MKNAHLLFIYGIFLSCSDNAQGLPHLMPDLDGRQYSALLQEKKLNQKNTFALEENKLAFIINFGQRNLEWFAHINNLRSDKLSFSTPENRRTYPVDSPSIYNEEIILEKYNNLVKELPAVMKQVLLENKPFTDDMPIAQDEYLHYVLLVDYVYQGAARWNLMQPYLSELKQKRTEDIRGYYALAKIADLNNKLQHFASLPENEQNQLKIWLAGICYNSETGYSTKPVDTKCQKNLSDSLNEHNGDATFFYNTYIEHSREIYNSYFTIPSWARRTDIVWSSEKPLEATVPFLEVNNELKGFMHNVELEWRWNDWQLVLNYVTSGNVPGIEFEAGSTPHVNGLGGNQIVMDANLPLNQWDNQWTIRHEFGHVLGFPDSYVEFYDESLKAMVNYQIDPSNLMSSRKGKFQETHFLEMKKNYYKEKSI